jgi:hypothetical protein
MMRKSFPLVATAALCLTHCANPTEILVTMDTTLGVPCQVDTLRLIVTGDGEDIVREAPASAGLSSATLVRASGGDAVSVTLQGIKRGIVVATAEATARFSDRESLQLPLVLTDACIAAPCDQADQLVPLAFSEPATRVSCDNFAERYRVSDQTGLLEIVNACDLGGLDEYQEFTNVRNSDVQITDEELLAKLPEFDFYYYGQKVSQLWMADDGYLSFGATAEEATLNNVTNIDGILSPGHPQNAVLPFWSSLSLRPDGGKMCAVLQSAGDQSTLWMTWKKACLQAVCAAGDELTFSVGLEEGSNRVTIAFDKMNSTASPQLAAGLEAVVGIVGPGEELGCDAASCSDEGLCADGTTPCGFTQVFSREAQSGNWPAIYVFTPVIDG